MSGFQFFRFSDFQIPGPDRHGEKLTLPASVAITAAMQGTHPGTELCCPPLPPETAALGIPGTYPDIRLEGTARGAGDTREVRWDWTYAGVCLKCLQRECPSSRKRAFQRPSSGRHVCRRTGRSRQVVISSENDQELFIAHKNTLRMNRTMVLKRCCQNALVVTSEIYPRQDRIPG